MNSRLMLVEVLCGQTPAQVVDEGLTQRALLWLVQKGVEITADNIVPAVLDRAAAAASEKAAEKLVRQAVKIKRLRVRKRTAAARRAKAQVARELRKRKARGYLKTKTKPERGRRSFIKGTA